MILDAFFIFIFLIYSIYQENHRYGVSSTYTHYLLTIYLLSKPHLTTRCLFHFPNHHFPKYHPTNNHLSIHQIPKYHLPKYHPTNNHLSKYHFPNHHFSKLLENIYYYNNNQMWHFLPKLSNPSSTIFSL